MAFDNRIQPDPSVDSINDPLRQTNSRPNDGDFRQPDIIANNPRMPSGRRNRQLMLWNVPGVDGTIQMYMNPQQVQIASKKIITKRRTQGGYVIQYWGEDLDVININGTTGSAGIEGINILEDIYRSEQLAFDSVSRTLADRLGSFNIGSLSQGIGAFATSGTGNALSAAISSMVGSGRNPPLLPTLASLAVAVELFWQGVVYKGYFDNFNVTESVSQGVGVFNYTMTFYATDKRGTRTNFMPWHRSPADVDQATGEKKNYRHADSEHTPFSFKGEE
jgi:hypothetical protein